MGEVCDMYGGDGKCTVLVKKSEGKRQLGRHSVDVRTILKRILME
jgi:hypothetical protein